LALLLYSVHSLINEVVLEVVMEEVAGVVGIRLHPDQIQRMISKRKNPKRKILKRKNLKNKNQPKKLKLVLRINLNKKRPRNQRQKRNLCQSINLKRINNLLIMTMTRS
jgi:hypothetical protein